MTEWQIQTPLVHGSLWVLSYATSLLGVLQIWDRALHDQAKTVAAFRRALALGGIGASIPERYAVAGARLMPRILPVRLRVGRAANRPTCPSTSRVA